VISGARPKIADYPFTTLEPHLGVVGLSDNRSFVVADIPGSLKARTKGRDSGCVFLQHIERTRAIAVLVPWTAQILKRPMTYETRGGVVSKELAAKPTSWCLRQADLQPQTADGRGLIATEAAHRWSAFQPWLERAYRNY